MANIKLLKKTREGDLIGEMEKRGTLGGREREINKGRIRGGLLNDIIKFDKIIRNHTTYY